MPIQMKNDGSGVDSGQNAPASSAGHTVISGGNAEVDLSAAILYLMDELNILRTHGAIGLAARTVADVAAGIVAKKT